MSAPAVSAGPSCVRVPLARQDVGRIIKARAGQGFSAHSLRVGMAQDLVEKNIETVAILNAGGWKDPGMLVRYTRRQAAARGAISKYYAGRAARHK